MLKMIHWGGVIPGIANYDSDDHDNTDVPEDLDVHNNTTELVDQEVFSGGGDVNLGMVVILKMMALYWWIKKYFQGGGM